MNTIEQDLALLGEHSSHQVMESLIKLGIRGARGNSCACPIFNYLRRKGHASLICTTQHHIDTQERAISTPKVVGQFIEAFDAGAYPTLEST
jgi:hypothetical protein